MKENDIESLVTSNEFEGDVLAAEFNELINFVLRKIPDSYAKKFPRFCIMENTRQSCVEGPDLESGEWYVNLSRDSENECRDIQIGVIAHELAHVCLRHKHDEVREGEKPKDHSKGEKEADELACRWGFRKEIEALRE